MNEEDSTEEIVELIRNSSADNVASTACDEFLHTSTTVHTTRASLTPLNKEISTLCFQLFTFLCVFLLIIISVIILGMIGDSFQCSIRDGRNFIDFHRIFL